MKRILKFIIGIVITVLLLVSIAVAGIAFFVNPNKIKPYLTKYVTDKTGHELSIEGKLKWSIYPQLGISAENVTVKNKPAFPDEPLLAAKSLTVSVQLIPLFSKNLNVDKIIVNDMQLNLTLNKANQANWEFNHSTKTSSNSNNQANKTKSYGIDISKVTIKNANIKYHNMVENRTTKITALNFTTKEIRPNKPFAVYSDFVIDSTPYEFNGKIQYHPEESLLLLQDYQFNIDNGNEGSFSGNAKINIKSERLELNPLQFKMADLQANGKLHGTHIFNNIDANGRIETNNFNPKALFSALGNPIRTQDNSALTSAKISSDISISPQSVNFKNINAAIDNTKLSGDAKYSQQKSQLSFNLTGDQIALDRYTVAKNGKKDSLSNGNKKENKKNDFTATGKVSFNSIYAKNARIDNFKSNVNYSDNILRFTNLRANIFEGSTSGSVTINTKPKTPIVQINQNLQQISVASAQNTIIGTAKITGRANARINISLQDGLKTFNGDINVISRNGDIHGIDVDYQLQRAVSFIKKITQDTAENRGKTPYDVLTAQINIKNGVANNPSMVIESNTMKVKARGTTNLVNKKLDYKLAARTKKPTEIDTENVHMDLSDYDIPIIVTGTIDDPEVSLDIKELAKITAKKQIIKTIEKHIIPGDGQPISDTIEKIKDALPF